MLTLKNKNLNQFELKTKILTLKKQNYDQFEPASQNVDLNIPKIDQIQPKIQNFYQKLFFFFKSITEELIKAASLPHIYLFDLRFPLVAIGYHVPSEVSSQARRYR